MRILRILLIGKTVSPGGTTRYVNHLVQSLKTQKLDFDFIDLKRFYNLSGKYMKRLDLIRKFPLDIKYDDYDLIHYLEFDYSLYGMLRHLRKKKRRPKIIKTSHGMFKREQIFTDFLGKHVARPFLCYSQRYVQQNADGVIYVSDEERELFLREYKLDIAKTYVVYLASTFETYKDKIQRLIENKENTILFVGRIERRKRVEKIFEVATLMPNTKFKIVGHISDFEYYDNLRKIKPTNVEVVIDLSDNELQSTYQRAKYFISFSQWESCPVTYLESISQGTPVVAYSMPIWKMEEGGCGYRVSSSADCVAMIKKLENRYASIAEKALSTANLFSWERVAKETIQVYEDILSST